MLWFCNRFDVFCVRYGENVETLVDGCFKGICGLRLESCVYSGRLVSALL